jgi:hypothetical protein
MGKGFRVLCIRIKHSGCLEVSGFRVKGSRFGASVLGCSVRC